MSREHGYNPELEEQAQQHNLEAEQKEKKVAKTIAFVDASEDNDQRARDIAEAELLHEKEEINGERTWKNLVPRLWQNFKFSKKYEYARQQKIAAAKERMAETGSWYAEKDEADETAQELAAVVERFVSDAEGSVRENEQKVTIEEFFGPEQSNKAEVVKDAIKSLIGRYATGTLPNKEAFMEARNRELGNSRVVPEEIQGQVVGMADNMFEMAENARAAFEHHKSLADVDLDFEIVIAKARTGVRTKAELNTVDKIVDKLKGTKLGQFVDETTLSAAVAIAYTAGAVAVPAIARSRAVAWASMGVGAVVGGGFTALRENKRLKEERAQHTRERAKGDTVKVGQARREKMEQFIHQTIPAEHVTRSLDALILENGDYTTQEIETLFHSVVEIDARIKFSDRYNADLIRYTNERTVERERLELDKVSARARVELKRLVDAGKIKMPADDWNAYYQSHVNAKSRSYGEQGEKLDQQFDKFKRKEVAKAAVKAVAIGLVVGGVAQEARALIHPGETGVIEGLSGKKVEYATTPAEWVRRYLVGEVSIGENPPAELAGSHAEIVTFIEENRGELTPEEYVQQNPELFTKIHRTLWYDNDTPKPVFDKNELKLWWGGDKNTGLSPDGDYEFDISHMKPKGSYHDEFSVDAQNAMKENKIKLLLSLNEQTQSQVVELEIGPDGKVIIPKDSEAGKLFFETDDKGKAIFKGRFAEVAEVMEPKDGVEQVRLLATYEGKGIDGITVETPPTEIVEPGAEPEVGAPPGDYPIYPPPIIPIHFRREMESLKEVPTGPVEVPGLGYLYGESTLEERKLYEERRSKNLKENPSAKLDQYQEIEDYLKNQDEDYAKNLEELVGQTEEMSSDVKLAICIPVAGHQEGKNIYRTLENYTTQTADSKDFEIVLFVNHPANTEPDETMAEIERFRKEHPDIQVRVMNQAVPVSKAKIGYVRKVLNDAVLERHHKRGAEAADLIMVSNDADNKGLSPTYVENFIHQFETHPETDGFLGQLDWDPESYLNKPLIHVGTRLFQYLDIQSRRKGMHIGSSGANFAFRSSIYAGVGGYMAETTGGEDTRLGEMIQQSRTGAADKVAIRYGGTRVSRLYTSSRRAIDALNYGKAPIEQWDRGFSAYDSDVRSIDAGLEDDIDFDNPEQIKAFLIHTERIVNRTLDRAKGWGITADEPSFRRAVRLLGIKYEALTPHQIKITDATKLVEALKKYKEEAGQYRGAHAEVRQKVVVPGKKRIQKLEPLVESPQAEQEVQTQAGETSPETPKLIRITDEEPELVRINDEEPEPTENEVQSAVTPSQTKQRQAGRNNIDDQIEQDLMQRRQGHADEYEIKRAVANLKTNPEKIVPETSSGEKIISIAKVLEHYPMLSLEAKQYEKIPVSKKQEYQRNFLRAFTGIKTLPEDIKIKLGTQYAVDKSKSELVLDITQSWEKIRDQLHSGLKKVNENVIRVKPLVQSKKAGWTVLKPGAK